MQINIFITFLKIFQILSFFSFLLLINVIFQFENKINSSRDFFIHKLESWCLKQKKSFLLFNKYY